MLNRGMTGIRCVVFVVVLTFLLSLARGEAEVSCVFMQSCILPCSFQGGTDMVIHWIQVTTGNTNVHSYYHNQDQLAYQNQNFNGRTSLFKDQISRGNASLQLTRVQVQDQGKYKCYTSIISGNQESFISLKVNDAAPVDPTSAITTPTQQSDEDEDEELQADTRKQDNILIGVIVGVIVVLAVTGVLTAFCIYNKTKACKKGKKTPEPVKSEESTPMTDVNKNRG